MARDNNFAKILLHIGLVEDSNRTNTLKISKLEECYILSGQFP